MKIFFIWKNIIIKTIQLNRKCNLMFPESLGIVKIDLVILLDARIDDQKYQIKCPIHCLHKTSIRRQSISMCMLTDHSRVQCVGTRTRFFHVPAWRCPSNDDDYCSWFDGGWSKGRCKGVIINIRWWPLRLGSPTTNIIVIKVAR